MPGHGLDCAEMCSGAFAVLKNIFSAIGVVALCRSRLHVVGSLVGGWGVLLADAVPLLPRFF